MCVSVLTMANIIESTPFVYRVFTWKAKAAKSMTNATTIIATDNDSTPSIASS